MTNFFSNTALVITILGGSLMLSNPANAQSSTSGQGGINGGFEGFNGTGFGSGSKGENENIKSARIPKAFNPNYNPRNPRRPKFKFEPQTFASQNSPCGVIYDQITEGNMLVMVPRYNDCMRRGLGN